MPIVLGDFDDDQMACCGNMEIQPRETGNAEMMQRQQNEDGQRMEERQRTDDRREQMQHMQNTQNMQSGSTMNQTMQARQPMVLAMAYVPWQRWNEVYAYDEGLHHGTIFPDLNLPFEGRRMGGKRR